MGSAFFVQTVILPVLYTLLTDQNLVEYKE